MSKKTFILNVETEQLWRRLWPTRGSTTESAAFAQFLFAFDEALRRRLDQPALDLYERGELNRSEVIRSFERHRAKRAANDNGEKQPVAAS